MTAIPEEDAGCPPGILAYKVEDDILCVGLTREGTSSWVSEDYLWRRDLFEWAFWIMWDAHLDKLGVASCDRVVLYMGHVLPPRGVGARLF